MRDCGGYGGDVCDFVGDAGTVCGADAVECAEGVSGIEERGQRGRERTRKGDAETLRFAESGKGSGSRVKYDELLRALTLKTAFLIEWVHMTRFFGMRVRMTPCYSNGLRMAGFCPEERINRGSAEMGISDLDFATVIVGIAGF